jgi:carboxyl-terminal processing protease
LPPEPAKEFSDDLKGKFEGIGAELAMRDNLITVVSPLLESPAEKAGLKPGDRITAINGESTENMTLNEAVSKIRGKKGTVVNLKIYREKDKQFHDIAITRDTIKIVSVKFEMKENNIAYLQITNFNEDTDERFSKAVNEILLKNPKGIILDMRSNPGGYLDRSITIASYWLPVGQVVVQEEFSADDKKQYLANGGAQLKDIPTIILVNGGSASASEIVAGALRDNGQAKLVGEKTFGKGSVQSLEELSDGSAVKLTVARWLTPKGAQINVVGLQPDEVVELTDEDFNAGKDPQMEKAMELLVK